jgi:Cof subfamily protein (haloacid dehalogenase superfamily)
MEIKAICADIDGTLLDKTRQLSARTISSIKQVAARMPVVLASSRMPSAMIHLQAELGILTHPLVCYNGGYVILYKDNQQTVFESITIPVDVCERIVELADNTSIHVSLYHADTWYAPRMDQWTEREETITKARAVIKNSSDVLAHWRKTGAGAHKVMCMGPANEISTIEKALRRQFDTSIHVYCSRDTYLELAPKQISKATGVALALEKLYNIPMSAVMAFGDNYNDIEMLKAAGFGVAVSNARDEVKSVADHITLKSVDDGVAAAIEEFCLNGKLHDKS